MGHVDAAHVQHNASALANAVSADDEPSCTDHEPRTDAGAGTTAVGADSRHSAGAGATAATEVAE